MSNKKNLQGLRQHGHGGLTNYLQSSLSTKPFFCECWFTGRHLRIEVWFLKWFFSCLYFPHRFNEWGRGLIKKVPYKGSALIQEKTDIHALPAFQINSFQALD
ncbi:hypothetical protein D3C84_721290 [compost metagenome]